MAKPVGKYRVFNIKRAYAAKVTSDLSSSITGPVLGAFREAPGVKKITVKNKNTIVKQPANGVGNYKSETYNEDSEMAVTFAERDDDLFAALFGTAFWLAPGSSTYSYTGESASSPHCILARTNQLGNDGQDLWLRIWSTKLGGDGVAMEIQKFSDFELTGTAELTQSKGLIIKDGVEKYDNLCWELINWEQVQSIIGTPVQTVPTLTPSVTPGATSVSRSAAITATSDVALNPNSVNAYTAWIETQDSTPVKVASAVSLSNDGLTITLARVASVQLASNTALRLKLSSTIESVSGISLAADVTRLFTTAT